jgi:hypothetical protein
VLLHAAFHKQAGICGCQHECVGGELCWCHRTSKPVHPRNGARGRMGHTHPHDHGEAGTGFSQTPKRHPRLTSRMLRE